MKKIMFMIALMGACFCNAYAAAEKTVDAYDIRMSLNVPYLSNGVRTYKTQSFKGTMCIEYTDGDITDTSVVMQNGKTKVFHSLQMTNVIYNLMGKTNKYSVRTVPTVYFEGCDTDTIDGHETIVKIAAAGSGTLKTYKNVVTGCSSCGTPSTSTSYCNKLYSISGNVVGVMDCQCPDDEEWSHTLVAGPCGVIEGLFEQVRSHEASFRGTWSAKYNAKLSATKTDAANAD